MRVLLGLTVFSFIGLSACQPKDIKVENPRFNKNSNNNNAGLGSLGKSEVTHEDMFQYALTRLDQGINLARFKYSDKACTKLAVLHEDAKMKVYTYSHQNCSLKEGAQSDDLVILGDRGVYEITFTKQDESKDFTFDNLQTLSLVTRVPLDVNIYPDNQSKRGGSVGLSEQTYLQITKTELADLWQFTFSVQSRFYEHVVSSKWESRADGEQSVYFRGQLKYDVAKKSLARVYLNEVNLKDIRPKEIRSTERKAKGQSEPETKEFKQIIGISLKYNDIDDKETPALALDISEEECWGLAGQGLLKKISTGFVNYIDKKSKDKKSSDELPILFNLTSEQLSLGARVVKWPSCNKENPRVMSKIAYGAIFLK